MSDCLLQQAVENVPYPHDTSGRYDGWFAELVRKRAYEIYEERGDRPSTAEQDWIRAERELRHHFGL